MPWRHNAQLWTSDEVAKLLRWRSDGLSSSEIAILNEQPWLREMERDKRFW